VSGRDPAHQSFAQGAAATQAGEVGFGPGFIQKNQAIGIDPL